MSKAAEVSNVLLGLSELRRKIIEEILIPTNSFVVRGRTIHMRFSEIDYLPEELSNGFKLPWLTYEVFAPYKLVTESDIRGTNSKKMKSFNTSLIKLTTQAKGKGVWAGYDIKAHANKIDSFQTSTHHIWGDITPDIDKEILTKKLQGGFIEEDKKRVMTITTADPIFYLFMLFYPIMGSDILEPMKVSRSTVRFKAVDLQAEANSEVDNIMIASDAIQWVKNLNVNQLKLLKPKVVGQVGVMAHALGVETTKEGMARELIKLCGKYGATILKFKGEVGGDVPREAIAKSILADAITTGILEPHKEFGLLVGAAHESMFNECCTRIPVDAINNTRLQFMPTATPTEWYGYIAANDNLVDVVFLETLVEKTVPTFGGERFKVGHYQALTSLMKTSGRLKHLYVKE